MQVWIRRQKQSWQTAFHQDLCRAMSKTLRRRTICPRSSPCHHWGPHQAKVWLKLSHSASKIDRRAPVTIDRESSIMEVAPSMTWIAMLNLNSKCNALSALLTNWAVCLPNFLARGENARISMICSSQPVRVAMKVAEPRANPYTDNYLTRSTDSKT